ncbi:uncharacterized protein ASPGLDRAFT_541555 [Aspergillus glaucus CBS 516.65]|uniref:Uncharacterized protein n=1 Tax=Aspergillus glaucus CBS 516.65 TaxID=1160497 RepID=A0A1L9VER7_ASPGL|nr:hypothetical protein ASPGLDRAFT_541555 [Aspergillus glaucus CBS 516.65]OJJ82427.1 hypothetical protein ASPGLDRAFT_541555 [Aspergillus glaucus CBS 516.65]
MPRYHLIEAQGCIESTCTQAVDTSMEQSRFHISSREKNVIFDRYLLLFCNSITGHRRSMKRNRHSRRSPEKRSYVSAPLSTPAFLSPLFQGLLVETEQSFEPIHCKENSYFSSPLFWFNDVRIGDDLVWSKEVGRLTARGYKAKNAKYHLRWRLAPLFMMRGRRETNVLDLSR